MKRNRILPYDPQMRIIARGLRKRSTETEKILWEVIRKKRLGYEFHRQVPIDHFVVDFYCHELMLGIEVDGGIHNAQEERDQERQLILESMGIRFIRFTAARVKMSLAEVTEELIQMIDELKHGE